MVHGCHIAPFSWRRAVGAGQQRHGVRFRLFCRSRWRITICSARSRWLVVSRKNISPHHAACVRAIQKRPSFSRQQTSVSRRGESLGMTSTVSVPALVFDFGSEPAASSAFTAAGLPEYTAAHERVSNHTCTCPLPWGQRLGRGNGQHPLPLPEARRQSPNASHRPGGNSGARCRQQGTGSQQRQDSAGLMTAAAVAVGHGQSSPPHPVRPWGL